MYVNRIFCSYYYDAETDLYYLQSRYYDPVIHRFINSDGYASTGQDFAGSNMFVYCGNNPITREDDGGQFWHILIGAAIGAAVSFTSSIVSGRICDGEVDWGAAVVSAGTGALTGGLTAAGVPTGVVVAVDAGCSAAESVVSDLRENARAGTEAKGFGEIIANAAISAGVSALFSASAGGSSAKEMSSMYEGAKAARKLLSEAGNHPTVKDIARKTISKYTKSLLKNAISDAGESIVSSAVGEFSVRSLKKAFSYCVRMLK